MVDEKIKISVIVPAYNAEKYLGRCLDSLKAQTVAEGMAEVIIIDDSSTDSTAKICSEYAESCPFISYFNIPHSGAGAARNEGIKKAKGSYIAFLDADDTISENTLEVLTAFFDKYYDETDLVTYRLIPVEKGIRKKESVRYSILRQSGVYDLDKEDNIYIGQNNINIAIKNNKDNNIFFDERETFKYEVQKFCTDVVKRKMTLGFCSEAEYLAERNKSGGGECYSPYKDFDVFMSCWEEQFGADGKAPTAYEQALFIDNAGEKIKADRLLPYHLEGEEFEKGTERIKNILKKTEDRIILNHPACGEMNKNYFLKLKYDGALKASFEEKIKLSFREKEIWSSDGVLLTFDRFKFHGDELEICGHFSSFVFDYCEKPQAFITVNGKSEQLSLYKSSFCYDEAKTVNNTAWGFRKTVDTCKETNLIFSVKILGKDCPFKTETGEWTVFDRSIGRTEYVAENKRCLMTDDGFSVFPAGRGAKFKYRIKTLGRYFPKSLKIFFVRLINLIIPEKRIWLYHDCGTSGTDNGYLQFQNDFYKKDGVKRYYVVNGSVEKAKKLFDRKQQKNLVQFRSVKHKLLYLNAEKIITAFIEKVNYLPFFDDVYKHYADLFSGEVIYLQHGVLHAHLPWKYSYDRLDITKEVISTAYELKNFTENYCFPESALIKSKMPRYDLIDCEKEPGENRILFAPSWRKYLIKLEGNGTWKGMDDEFLKSDYFVKTSEFLNSPELLSLLEDNDWYLDFKPHPIFGIYNKYFRINNGRVSMPEKTEPENYKIFMTDYSSFVFDFVYLKRAVVYFMPDFKQFRAGLNDYRELDIPFEDGFGEFTQTAAEAVSALERIIKNDGKSIPPFDMKNKDFFFNTDKNCCETVYRTIK